MCWHWQFFAYFQRQCRQSHIHSNLGYALPNNIHSKNTLWSGEFGVVICKEIGRAQLRGVVVVVVLGQKSASSIPVRDILSADIAFAASVEASMIIILW